MPDVSAAPQHALASATESALLQHRHEPGQAEHIRAHSRGGVRSGAVHTAGRDDRTPHPGAVRPLRSRGVRRLQACLDISA